jgi:Kef-type K+ transport system membrane component KefB
MALQNLNITALNEQLDLLINQNPYLLPIIFLIAIWKISWYGVALYYAAKRQQKIWFVVLMACAFLLNDLGLLAIVYVFVSKRLENQINILKNKKTLKRKSK